MGFEDRIEAEVDRVAKTAERNMRRALGQLVSEMCQALRDGDWGAFDVDTLSDTIDALHVAATELDSVECVRSRVLDAQRWE